MHEPVIHTGVDNDIRLAVREINIDDPRITTPVDTTDWSISAEIRALSSDATPMVALSSAEPEEISPVLVEDGIWDLHFSASLTAGLTPGKHHLFVFGAVPGGKVRLIHEGRIAVRSGVLP